MVKGGILVVMNNGRRMNAITDKWFNAAFKKNSVKLDTDIDGGNTAAEHTLAVLKDHIQVGMAGNLKDFVLINHDGDEVFIHGVFKICQCFLSRFYRILDVWYTSISL
ncbi:unnamed protein product [Cuscuta europaea]|uniref:Uncharacterized protein n=1 Tax=Cuscuta europaea TaxID=41803 RepID=A0A9P1EK17_CUSEU|nr:unnamed protein product [Cuscuta europaea]